MQHKIFAITQICLQISQTSLIPNIFWLKTDHQWTL